MADSGNSRDDSSVDPRENSIPANAVPLESILCTEELQRRPSRPPDYEKENRALVALMSLLADSPNSIFQTLAETILDITQCDSAGLSLLTRDGKTPDAGGKRFYWPAIAGMWNPHVGGGTPRNFGPCGDVLDQNRTLLFRHFERRYPYLRPVIPAAEECLLVPFYVAGEAVGTIWGIMHTDRRKFDAEDDRVMASLGKFASSAYQAVLHIENLKFQVAEREKAEAEVRELAKGLEAKIRRLVDANVVGIVMFALEGAITGANDAFLHTVGYDRGDLASGRLRWTDLTPAEWRDRDDRAIAELKTSGIFQPFEKEYFRKDGSRVPVLLGGALFEDSGSEGVAFVLDLTEQKGEESARLYSEERYRVVVETASDAVVGVDDAGSIVFANPATSTIFGYDPADLFGKPLTVLMPEYMRDLHNSGFERYLATGHRHMNWQGTELTACRKNGEEFPVEVSFGELSRDGHKTFTGFLRDISRRKRTEQALRRSEALLAESQRLSLTGSFSWKVATDEITWSEQLYRIYELEIGVPVTLDLIRTRVHPEDVSLIEKMRMFDRAQAGSNDFEWHFRLLMPDHSIKYLHAVSHAIRDRNGQVEYVAAIQDVTARRVSEEALAKARSELADATRITSLGALTASIAHEVNQPLSGIMTNAATCLRMLNTDPPNVDGARETVRRTVRDGNRASEVITRLRALFSQKESATASVDLNEATREVIALSLSELQSNRVVLRIELADNLPLLTGDRVQLQQVILNLLRNASDAMRHVDDRERRLVVKTERDEGDCVRLTVQDAGVGFDPQAADRLFEAFYTTKAGGMGIGLSLSRSIIERHSGRLWAARNDGPGATFAFSIPREAQVTAARSAQARGR
ncbi:MAG TPA: PAS domain S-box protein [Candidatus Sulfotelmatobacter sp.]|nr:PAS domain S-box protein [Candidatus Sulfotelmatobacter sp.]